MKSMGISEFKAKCIRVLKELHRNRTSLIVTHRGRPLVRVEAIEDTSRRRLGVLRDVIRIHGDIVHTDFADEWEMEQG